MASEKIALPLFSAVLVLLAASPAMATNGMNMIGYNVRASGMGGADVAIDTDCSGSACNPAAMGQQRERSMAAGLSLLVPQIGVEEEAYGIDRDGETQYFPLPYLAYAQRLSDTSPWTLGFDLFAQGGMGVDVRNYPTPGGPGSFDSQVGYSRLTGAASYRVNSHLSLGIGAIVGYANMKFSLFPQYPGGISVDELSSFGYAGRVGMHYRVNDKLSLGAQYTTEAALDLDGGTLTANYGPAGNVEYDAEMNDFTWPQEAEIGLAYKVTRKLLLAADLKWIGWSQAIDVVKVKPSGGPLWLPPPTSPGSDSILFDMNWEDQWVIALGMEYAINSMHTIRLGYNYGKSPVPDNHLSPLFPAIVEHHVTLGYGLTFDKWGIDLAYEHAFENTQTNNNPDPLVNPFGPGLTVSQSQNTVHFAVTYFF